MKIKKKFPMILTYSNFIIGSSIIMLGFWVNNVELIVKVSSGLIMLSAILDRYDGFFARKFNVESNFGKEMDSFADFICFGIAPVIIIWKLHLIIMGIYGFVPVLTFITCSATRLARYNISQDNYYTGIPTTVAGFFLAILNLLSYLLLDSIILTNFYPVFFSMIIIILALGMISNFRIKNIYFRWEKNSFS